MVELAKCDDCGYVGNFGIWKGEYIKEGKKHKFKGNVKIDGETWDCDDILPKEIDSFDGMSYCPFCDSINFD